LYYAESEYFSDGLAQELINELVHVPGLKVIARTSAFAFKGKQEDIRNIARALGVENIVEGSVRRAGARVRVTAQLIAARDGTHLWSERYDREIADIFAVQDEIAQAIAVALRVRLSCTLRQYIPRLPAYEEYLKARHYLAAFTRESLQRSRYLYENAIGMDADFAPAHSGLAMALVSLVLPGITPAHTAMPLAHAAARRALDIDPASQEAHAVLGMVAALYYFDWKEAKRRFQLAMAREHVSPYVCWYFSFSYLLPMGRTQESVRVCVRGMEDDPLNFMGGFHYAGALLAGGNTEAGEAYLRQLSDLYSNLYQSYYLLSLSQAIRGLHKEALASAEKAYSLAPWSTTTRGLLAGILKCTGETNRADELRGTLLAGDQYGVAMGLSLFHVGCAEMGHAGEWAERAVEQRDARMILLMGLLRAFRPNLFRSDRRWSAIAGTLGIPTGALDD
jgi:TolB-like protein